MTLNLPDKEICEEYISGLSLYQIANNYNCSVNTILQRLNKYNIDIRHGIDLPDKEICDEYISGMSTNQLANKYNCHIETIYRRLNKNRIELRLGGKILLPDKEIYIQYLNGMSINQLANKYNCSENTILRKLHKSGLEIMNYNLDLPEKEICDDYLNGMTACEIGIKYNCSDETIYNKLRKNNIKIQSHRITVDLPIIEICNKYLNGITPSILAKEYNCSYSTIRERLIVAGISMRTYSDIKVSDISRQRQSATRQGISYDEWEDYAAKQLYCPDFNEECRESNRDKYDRMCFLTGLPELENIGKDDEQRKLSVHHYNMDKGQGCNGKKWKLIPVCMEWHGKVHNKLWEARIIWLLDNVWN